MILYDAALRQIRARLPQRDGRDVVCFGGRWYRRAGIHVPRGRAQAVYREHVLPRPRTLLSAAPTGPTTLIH